nr:uncharacterized protein LOC109151345 [Ipomoea batatas]GMD04033.1 uncharacterized protein LOC109151345 [Ipomoea batatas]
MEGGAAAATATVAEGKPKEETAPSYTYWVREKTPDAAPLPTRTQTQTLPDSESQPLTDPNADSGLGSDPAFLTDAPIDIPRNHSNPSKIPIRPPENPKTFNPGDQPNNQIPTHLGSAYNMLPCRFPVLAVIRRSLILLLRQETAHSSRRRHNCRRRRVPFDDDGATVDVFCRRNRDG